MHHHIRLFVAVPLSESLKQQLQNFADVYKQPGVRLVPEKNLHLTLFFIGNTDPGKLPAITAELTRTAGCTTPFELQLEVVEPGPKVRHPRLVWARFTLHQEFAALSHRITAALAEQKEPPPKPVPHITLARFSKDTAIPELPVLTPEEIIRLEVTEVALWQSELGQPHPEYSILNRFPLKPFKHGTTNHT